MSDLEGLEPAHNQPYERFSLDRTRTCHKTGQKKIEKCGWRRPRIGTEPVQIALQEQAQDRPRTRVTKTRPLWWWPVVLEWDDMVPYDWWSALWPLTNAHNATLTTLGRVAGTVHSSATSRNEFQRARGLHDGSYATSTKVRRYGCSSSRRWTSEKSKADSVPFSRQAHWAVAVLGKCCAARKHSISTIKVVKCRRNMTWS